MSKAKTIRFDLSGFDGVEEVLQALGKNYGDTVERRLSRAALGAGLTQCAKLIRQAAPKGTSLRKSVGTRFKKNRRAGVHEAKAGLNVGRKNGSAPHAHFFTLGTVDRFTKRGDPRGRITPDRFVRRAILSGHPSISKAMIDRIKARLPVEVQRLRLRASSNSSKGYWAQKISNVKLSPSPTSLPDNNYG